MQNRPMDPDLPTVRESLFRCSEEPPPELAPPLHVLYLFVILHIVAYDQVRTLALPHRTTDALLCAAGEDTKSPAIIHHDDDLCTGIDFEALHSVIVDQILVVVKLFRNVGELLRRLLLRGANEDDIIARAEEGLTQDVSEGEGGALSGLTGGYDFDLRVVGGVECPALSMEGRGGPFAVVARREERPGEGLQEVSGQVNRAVHQCKPCRPPTSLLGPGPPNITSGSCSSISWLNTSSGRRQIWRPR